MVMETVLQLAYENVRDHKGGPFGAVVVKDGNIVATGVNQVTALNDPTAHAEMQAIRAACEVLNTFQLKDCEIYTSCEPCPMCIGAIYWARPKAVYYASTKEEAATVGFDDDFIYKQIALPKEKRFIEMKQIATENRNFPFEAWVNSNDKKVY